MALGEKSPKRQFEKDYGIGRLGYVAKRLIWVAQWFLGCDADQYK